MSALIFCCATSMLHVPHRHISDLIDMVVPVSHLTGRCHLHVGYVRYKTAFSMYLDQDGVWFGDQSAVFFSQISSKIGNFVFVQNAKFCGFSSKTNFLHPFTCAPACITRPTRSLFIPAHLSNELKATSNWCGHNQLRRSMWNKLNNNVNCRTCAEYQVNTRAASVLPTVETGGQEPASTDCRHHLTPVQVK